MKFLENGTRPQPPTSPCRGGHSVLYLCVLPSTLTWSKEPPPPGGFPIHYVPWSRIRRKRTPLQNHPQNWPILGVVLLGGSSSSEFLIGNIVNRKPPRGGEFFSIKVTHWLCVLILMCDLQGGVDTVSCICVSSPLQVTHWFCVLIWMCDLQGRDWDYVTWLIHMCDMTHSHVWRDPFTRVTWLIRMCNVTHFSAWRAGKDAMVGLEWCDMTHWCVWHDSYIRVTWLIDVCDMTHTYVWHDSLMCVTWLIHACDMTHSCVWHDSCLCSYMWHDASHTHEMHRMP